MIEEVAETAIEASLEEAAAVTIEVEAPAAEAPVEETSAEDEAKANRGNRGENVTSSAPVVRSSSPTEGGEDDPNKPRKAGWWQRRGFL
jgi:ribonuclease E